jgi:type IV pilus assembly protein PilQ
MRDMKTGITYKKCFRLVIGAVLVIAVACACTTTKPVAKDPFMGKWRDLAEKSKGYSPSSKRYVLEAPKAGSTHPTDSDVQVAAKKPLPTKLITLKMHNVDVAVLLRALARAAGQNIVVNEKVTGKTSLFIHDAPWDEVFRGILISNGLTHAWEGNIIRILTVEDMEIDLKRETQKKSLRLVEPFITRVIPIHYAEAAKMKENLATLLTKGKDEKPLGTVMVDEHNNALIIQSIRRDIERMIPLIEKLDQPSVQILIEAHIVEATSDVARSLGIQWGGLVNQGSFWAGGNVYNNGFTGNALSDGAIDPTTGLAADFGAAIAGSGVSPLAIGFAIESIGKSLLTAQLSALQTEGKAKILSSPSITTLDNQPARIESGSEVPFQTVSQGEIGVEYKKAVLSLEVTPHVIEGDTLKLKINTSKDELDLVNTVSGNPIINTQKAETNVILFNGQTTVIGGLKKENLNDAEAGLPGIKDIPLLGYLFKNKTKSNNLRDILIFITPHILKEKPRSSKEIGQKEQQKNAPKLSSPPSKQAPAADSHLATTPEPKTKAPANQQEHAATAKPVEQPAPTKPAERTQAPSVETTADASLTATAKIVTPKQSAATAKPVEKPVSVKKATPASLPAVVMDNDEILAKTNDSTDAAPRKTPAIVEHALATETKPALAVAQQPPSAPPTPQIKKSVKQTPSARSYTIQVGAFRNRQYAEERMQNLRTRGYQPYLFSALDGRKNLWYTVRVGAYRQLDTAAQALYTFTKKQPYKAVVTRTGSLTAITTKPPLFESRSKEVLLSDSDHHRLKSWPVRNNPGE